MRKRTSEEGRVLPQSLGQAGTQSGSPDAQGTPPPGRHSSDDRALPLPPAAPPCRARRPEGSGQRRAPAAAACQTLCPALRPALPRPPRQGGPALAPRLVPQRQPQIASGWSGCLAARDPAPAPGCRPSGRGGSGGCGGCGASGGARSGAPSELQPQRLGERGRGPRPGKWAGARA